MGLIELNPGTPEYEEFFKDVPRNKITRFPCEIDHKEMESDEWIQLAAQYRIVKENLKTLEAMESEIRNKLTHLAGTHSSTGGGLSITKIVRKGAIDYTVIPQLKDMDLEPYRKDETVYWKVSVLSLD